MNKSLRTRTTSGWKLPQWQLAKSKADGRPRWGGHLRVVLALGNKPKTKNDQVQT